MTQARTKRPMNWNRNPLNTGLKRLRPKWQKKNKQKKRNVFNLHDINTNSDCWKGHRHVNQRPIDHLYKCHEKHKSFTCSTTLQGLYPYQQIKVRFQLIASITKKHDSMQHPRSVVPTKSGQAVKLQNAKYHHLSLFGDYKSTRLLTKLYKHNK